MRNEVHGSARGDWAVLRDRRLAEPAAAEAYGHARTAFELGTAVRSLREERGWTQRQLAEAAGMTQPAVARFEAGGTTPTLAVLDRVARALGVDLVVRFDRRTPAA